MTAATRSPSASALPTGAFEQIFSPPGFATETGSRDDARVYNFEQYATPAVPTPEKHTSIGDLVTKWDKDEKRRAAMEEARRWAADTLHGEDGDTLRTLRLRKGWSQVQLAERLSTSQSHVARMERGTENLAISTCRRLCEVFGIDMNTLDRVLVRQEAIAREREAI